MFSKLLRHEWRASANLLSVLSLAAIGAGLLGGLLLRAVLHIRDIIKDEELATLGTAGIVMVLAFLFLGLLAYVIAVEFITLFRFYKNKFTDEGYLTFTLPVKTNQIFWSSFIHILAWALISVLVFLVSCCLILMIGAGEYIGQSSAEIMEFFGFYQDTMIIYPGYEWYQALTTVQTMLSPVIGIILTMTCITIGSVLVKRNKLLLAIGIEYGVSMVLSVISSILSLVPSILLLSSTENYEQNIYSYMNITVCINIGVQLLAAVLAYFLAIKLMKRKLNLP